MPPSLLTHVARPFFGLPFALLFSWGWGRWSPYGYYAFVLGMTVYLIPVYWGYEQLQRRLSNGPG